MNVDALLASMYECLVVTYRVDALEMKSRWRHQCSLTPRGMMCQTHDPHATRAMPSATLQMLTHMCDHKSKRHPNASLART